MGIRFIEDKNIFKLDTATSTYVIEIFEQGYLLCPYYGAKIPDVNFKGYMFREYFASFSPNNASVEDVGRMTVAYGSKICI